MHDDENVDISLITTVLIGLVWGANLVQMAVQLRIRLAYYVEVTTSAMHVSELRIY